MTKNYLTEKELAAKLNMSRWTIRTLRLKHGLPYIPVGSYIFYDYDSVQNWFTSKETTSKHPIAEETNDIGNTPVIRKRNEYSMPKLAG